jgi:hypothetical protein
MDQNRCHLVWVGHFTVLNYVHNNTRKHGCKQNYMKIMVDTGSTFDIMVLESEKTSNKEKT